MSTPVRKRPRKDRDVTGWLLGGTILVLATLDLCVWATLWNVPNPISKLFGTESARAGSVHHAETLGPPFH
jgi:hypothetical protein